MSDSDDEYNPAEVTVVVTGSQVATDAPSTAGGVASIAAANTTPRALASQPPAMIPSAVTSAATAAAASDDLPLDKGGLRLHALKNRVRCLCVNPQGTLLCAGGDDGQLAMWDFTVPLPTRRVQPTRVLTPFVNRISGLQPIVATHFSSDGSYVVACQDGDCPSLVAAGGKQLGYCAMGERGLADVVRCKGHRAPVTTSAPHMGEAARFYTASQDGTGRLWDQASFERQSIYAVKHGSGQITDTVPVEAILGLCRFHGAGGGAVFATAGEDGCVQLWDSRTKYRPGGVLAVWDVYGLPRRLSSSSTAYVTAETEEVNHRGSKASMHTSGCSNDKAEEEEEVFERHTGGMAELTGASGDAILCVRRGTAVQFLDLRHLPPPRSVGKTANYLAATPVLGLSRTTDSPPLQATADGRGFVTGTAHAGLNSVVGGHVALYTLDIATDIINCSNCSGEGGENAALAVPSLRAAWRAGTTEDDVLCAATDSAGRLYAGLSSGDVVVQRPLGSLGDGSPVDRWLDSRPARGVGARTDFGDGVARAPGQKSVREEDVNVEDLF